MVQAGSERCDITRAGLAAAEKEFYRVQVNFRCTKSTASLIEIRTFFEQVPFHLHFARVQVSNQGSTRELSFVLNRNSTTLVLDQSREKRPASGFSRVFFSGITHIVIGIDHVLFLIGLLLLSKKPLAVFLLATGFTLGHSLSLAAAAFSLVAFAQQPIEALIGFTVFIVAADYILIRNGNKMAYLATVLLISLSCLFLKFYSFSLSFVALSGLLLFSIAYWFYSSMSKKSLLVITVVFGLVHGLGFASVLDIQDIGLIQILAFNLGVEAGQVFIILFTWPLVILLKKNDTASKIAAATMAATGLFWFYSRGMQGL